MSDPQTDTATDSRSPRKVKILGERNTGSGYLERLLIRNLQIDCLPGSLPRTIQKLFPESERARDWFFRATSNRNLGWKHAFAPNRDELGAAALDPNEILFLTLTKNPYAWLMSLYRRPYHAKRMYSNFSDFLSTPWETVARERAPSSFENPIELWNQKNASYLALGEYATSLLCRYEDLLEAPLDFLKTLSIDYAISPRLQPFANVQTATKGRDRGKTFDDYQDYYLNERWRKDLNEADTRLINQSLDEELMSRLQYEWIEPSERADPA